METVRTEFFIETTEVFVIRRRRYFVRTWCAECEREVNMISAPEAALMVCRNADDIYSLAEKNCVHHRRLKDETLLVCLRSLCSAFQT